MGRNQLVILEGCHLEWTEVASGVPQGSVLGPLLFLIYVNDLPEVVQCSVNLFVDDTKLYLRVSSTDEAALLQSDIQALSRWSNTWLMPFNQSKCKVLHLGHTNQGFPYTMGDIPPLISPLWKRIWVSALIPS